MTNDKLMVGDAIRLVPGAKYSVGTPIPARFFNVKLYLREIKKNGDYIFSTSPTGKVNGTVKEKDVIPYVAGDNLVPVKYLVRTLFDTEAKINPTDNSKVKYNLKAGRLYNIVEEKDNWGLLKVGGWINLDHVSKIN